LIEVAPYRFDFDLGRHGNARNELVLAGGARMARPYFGYFGVGVAKGRGQRTERPVHLDPPRATLKRWRQIEKTVLKEVAAINRRMLKDLDRAADARQGEAAVDRAYAEMTALSEKYRPVWDEVNSYVSRATAPRWPVKTHYTEAQIRQHERNRESGGGGSSG
jgi:hypothetical protein